MVFEEGENIINNNISETRKEIGHHGIHTRKET
jgi:hypothetical protein